MGQQSLDMSFWKRSYRFYCLLILLCSSPLLCLSVCLLVSFWLATVVDFGASFLFFTLCNTSHSSVFPVDAVWCQVYLKSFFIYFIPFHVPGCCIMWSSSYNRAREGPSSVMLLNTCYVMDPDSAWLCQRSMVLSLWSVNCENNHCSFYPFKKH